MEARGSEVVVALEATLGAGKSTLLRMLVDDARADGLALALGGNLARDCRVPCCVCGVRVCAHPNGKSKKSGCHDAIE